MSATETKPETENHNLGTGVGVIAGAASGTSIGAAAGAAGGPAGASVGAVVGGVVGAVVGGVTGKTIAELVNPSDEESYWQQNYRDRPYVAPEATFETYRPAYRYGYDSRSEHPDKHFHEIEADLRAGWEKSYPASPLIWDEVREAVRDSYDRTGQQYKVRLGEWESVSQTA